MYTVFYFIKKNSSDKRYRSSKIRFLLKWILLTFKHLVFYPTP
jgi:hypothetical protein